MSESSNGVKRYVPPHVLARQQHGHNEPASTATTATSSYLNYDDTTTSNTTTTTSAYSSSNNNHSNSRRTRPGEPVRNKKNYNYGNNTTTNTTTTTNTNNGNSNNNRSYHYNNRHHHHHHHNNNQQDQQNGESSPSWRKSAPDTLKSSVQHILRVHEGKPEEAAKDVETLCKSLSSEENEYMVLNRICQFGRADVIDCSDYLKTVLRRCSRFTSRGYCPIFRAIWPERGVDPTSVLHTIRYCMALDNFSPISRNAEEETVLQSLYKAYNENRLYPSVYRTIYKEMTQPSTKVLKRLATEMVNKTTLTNVGQRAAPYCWVLSRPGGKEIVAECVFSQLVERSRQERPGKLSYVEEAQQIITAVVSASLQEDFPLASEFKPYFETNPWGQSEVDHVWETILHRFTTADLETMQEESSTNPMMDFGAAVGAMVGEMYDVDHEKVKGFVVSCIGPHTSWAVRAIHHSNYRLWQADVEKALITHMPKNVTRTEVDVQHLLRYLGSYIV